MAPRIRRPRYPELAEAYYVTQVQAFLRPLDAAIRRHVLPVVNAYRGTSERDDGDDVRLDDAETDLVIALGRVRSEWLGRMRAEQMEVRAARAARRIDRHNARDQARVLRSVAVVDLFKSESYLAAELPAWIQENTALIVRGPIPGDRSRRSPTPGPSRPWTRSTTSAWL